MVKYHTLIKTIDHYIKCHPTIPEKRQLLSGMSQDEKWEKLDNVLNQGEKEWYEKLLELREHTEKWIERERVNDNTIGSYYRELVDESLPQIEADIFKLERKIFEKPKTPKPIPEINESDYQMEEQYPERRYNKIGELEQRQIDLQDETVKFTFEDYLDVGHYFGEGYQTINKKLYQGNDFMRGDKYNPETRKKTVRRVNQEIRTITSAINRTPGLVENTTVFHGGYFDVTKTVGDKVKFKGFTSTSYQRNIAEWMKFLYKPYPDELFYTYKILLPQGHKGLCANGSIGKTLTFARVPREQELLLDKGFEGTVLNIDYSTHTVTLLADE